MLQTLSQALISDYASFFTDARLSGDKGIVYSSWSLFHTLFIFLATVVGPVHNDVLNAIQLSDEATAPASVAQVLTLFKSDPALALAANIYAKNVVPTKEFTALVKKYFEIDIEPLCSAEQVNTWCFTHTRGLIRSIVDDVSNTDAILVSAIHFKADWKFKFSKDETKKRPFTSLDGSQQDRDLMSMKAKLQYAESDTAQIVKLQYNDSGVFAIIVLPKETGKAALKAALSHDQFFPQGGFATIEVMLRIPKFKIETTHNLRNHLILRGAKSMFEACDCRQSLGAPMTVTEVIQKAVIEVDENGTEAAAVTAIRMLRCAMPMNPPRVEHVICDRPFWFMLERDGVPLFLAAIL